MFTAGVHAQFAPAAPTSADLITFEVSLPYSSYSGPTIVRDGTQIRVTFHGVPSKPAFDVRTVSLGRLPAGQYTVTLVVIHESDPVSVVESVFSLAVTQADVPVLDGPAMTLLIALLGGIAVVAIKT